MHGLFLRANQRIRRFELENLFQAAVLRLQRSVHIHRVLDADPIELHVTYRSLVIQFHTDDGTTEERPNETTISNRSSSRQESRVNIPDTSHRFLGISFKRMFNVSSNQ